MSASAPEGERPGHRYFHQGRELAPDEFPLWVSVRDDREIRGLELEMLAESGKRWSASVNAAPVRDLRGNVVGGIAVTTDITERKRAEQALREAKDHLEIRVKERTAELEHANRAFQEEIAERKRAEEAVNAERQRFNDALEMLPAYLVLLTPDHHVPFANRFFRERYGESHGRRCFEYLFGRSEPCEICETYRALKTMASHEWEWTGPDGRNYDVFDFPFTDTDGSTLIMEVGLDITERKRAEEELRGHQEHLEQLVKERTADLESRNAQLAAEIAERKRAEQQLTEALASERAVREQAAATERLLSTIVENTNTSLAYFDRDLRFLRVNSAYLKATGRTVEELIGRHHLDVWHDPERLAALERVRDSGESVHFAEYVFAIPGQPQERVRYWDWLVVPIKDEDGAVHSLVTSATDITEQAEARERIAAAERERAREARLLETIVENTDTQLVYLDRDFRFVRVNSAYARGSGHSREELVGRNHFDLFPSRENRAIFEWVRDTGDSIEFREKPFAFADQPERGVTYWDWTLTPLRGETPAVEGLVLSLTDVTEQVRARERSLAAERARTHMAETLVNEVNHRTKNNLAIVAGLLQMQVDSEPEQSPAASVLREAINRIRTFSIVHEQMYETQARSVELLDAMRRIAEIQRESLSTGDVEMSVAGQPVSYPTKIATTLCVVAGELLINAIKYGAPGEEGKTRINVSLGVKHGTLDFSIWNSGNPVPNDFDPSKQRTMGLRLIYDMVVRQYGGSFTIRPHRGGTIARIALDDERLREEE